MRDLTDEEIERLAGWNRFSPPNYVEQYVLRLITEVQRRRLAQPSEGQTAQKVRHLSRIPFTPWCGADEPNQHTTDNIAYSNCFACLRALASTPSPAKRCQMKGGECHGGGGCTSLGYERLAAILTPEVLRMIEAGREPAESDKKWLAGIRVGEVVGLRAFPPEVEIKDADGEPVSYPCSLEDARSAGPLFGRMAIAEYAGMRLHPSFRFRAAAPSGTPADKEQGK